MATTRLVTAANSTTAGLLISAKAWPLALERGSGIVTRTSSENPCISCQFMRGFSEVIALFAMLALNPRPNNAPAAWPRQTAMSAEEDRAVLSRAVLM